MRHSNVFLFQTYWDFLNNSTSSDSIFLNNYNEYFRQKSFTKINYKYKTTIILLKIEQFNNLFQNMVLKLLQNF